MSTIIRRATVKDINAIMKMNEHMTEVYSKGTWSELLHKHVVYIAEVAENGIIGYIGACTLTLFEFGQEVLSLFPKKNAMTIFSLFVLPNHTGKGIGQQLCQTIINHLENIMPDDWSVILNVRISNESAIHIYKKFNFQITYQLHDYYDTPVEDAYAMVYTKTIKNMNPLGCITFLNSFSSRYIYSSQLPLQYRTFRNVKQMKYMFFENRMPVVVNYNKSKEAIGFVLNCYDNVDVHIVMSTNSMDKAILSDILDTHNICKKSIIYFPANLTLYNKPITSTHSGTVLQESKSIDSTVYVTLNGITENLQNEIVHSVYFDEDDIDLYIEYGNCIVNRPFTIAIYKNDVCCFTSFITQQDLESMMV